MNAVSSRQRKRNRGLKSARAVIIDRSGERCEACRYWIGDEGQGHHVFRRNRIAREITDRPECIAYLCGACHDFVTVTPNGPLDVRLMRLAYERLTGVLLDDGEDVMAAIRAYEREHVA